MALAVAEDVVATLDRTMRRWRAKASSSAAFVTPASHAESGRVYTICVDAETVNAEFLTKGRGDYSQMVFFRQTVKGGRVLVRAIPSYSLVKEAVPELRERG